MDPELLEKLVTEDELIKAFDGKVLDDILKTSNAYNKPFEDLCPENTIALEAQIERIEQSSPGFEDLEPSENTAKPNDARAHIGKSNSEGAQIRKSTTGLDKFYKRDNEWLKTAIWENRFIFLNKAIVEHVVKEFNERVEFGENYGKKPAAKPTVKHPYKNRSSKKSTKVNTVEEEEDRLMTPPRKKKTKTSDEFLTPMEEEGMETEWMRVYDGERFTKLTIKRAPVGTRWAFMFQNSNDSETDDYRGERVIVEKTRKNQVDIWTENMSDVIYPTTLQDFLRQIDFKQMVSSEDRDYEFAKRCVRDRIMSSVRHDNEKLQVSPTRAKLRGEAFVHMRRQAEKMMKYAYQKRGPINVGDCVKVPIPAVDQSRFDGTVLIGVVVRVTTGGRLQIACKAGVLDHNFCSSHVSRLEGVKNNQRLNELEDAFKDYQGLPKVSVRQAARYVSQTGGQGIARCSCPKGDCSTARCPCVRVEVKCTNKCKCNCARCKNRETE